jgi:hypothetical protein
MSATLVAEFIQIACIETDFVMSMSMMDTDSTFCMYAWNYPTAATQQFKFKRLHADGSQEDEQILYDFTNAPGASGGFYAYSQTIYLESALNVIFKNSSEMICLVVSGGIAQAFHFPISPVGVSYMTSFNEDLYFVAFLGYPHANVWKWTLETGEISMVYDASAFMYPKLSCFGENLLISERDIGDTNGPYPVHMLDAQLNPTVHYCDYGRIEKRYAFDEYTYYASWLQPDVLDCGGVISLADESLDFDLWTLTDYLDPTSTNFNFLFELPNNLHACWRNSANIYGSYKTFRLYHHDPNAGLSIYNGFPVAPNVFDYLIYSAKFQDKLLLIDYVEDRFVFRLADLDAAQWVSFTEDEWQPLPETSLLTYTTIYKGGDRLVINLTSQDANQNTVRQYYFLKLNLSTSTDDPLNPPPALLAYPNPFKESITISRKDLQAPQALNIYNLRGQKVRSIAGAGQAYEWDGKDDLGRSLGAGIYFARESGSKQSVKLVKLKQ